MNIVYSTVPQQAGLGGYGGSSYINGVVLRTKDANTAWTSASDGVLEEELFYCQNWRGDVSALVKGSGNMAEWVKYSAYGVPFGLPGADTNSDGDCDAADVTQIQAWIDAPAYDVRGDVDLDGDVDATDKAIAQSAYYQGLALGHGSLSGKASALGYAGYVFAHNGLWQARNRELSACFGRWLRRDPLEYADSMNLAEYVGGNPQKRLDPLGLGWATQVVNVTGKTVTVYGDKPGLFSGKKINPLPNGQGSLENGWGDADGVLVDCGSGLEYLKLEGWDNNFCVALCEKGHAYAKCWTSKCCMRCGGKEPNIIRPS